MAYNKYKAVKTVVDGIAFHSKRESKRWMDLLLLVRAGEISSLERQIWVDLHVNGKSIGRWVADFRYLDRATGKYIYEDCKGYRTQLYRWKKKHFEAEYKMKILET